MTHTNRTIDLTTTLVSPLGSSTVSYRPQRIMRVDRADPGPGVGIGGAVIGGHRINHASFPWHAAEPGDMVKVVLVNHTGRRSKLSVTLHVTEVS